MHLYSNTSAGKKFEKCILEHLLSVFLIFISPTL